MGSSLAAPRFAISPTLMLLIITLETDRLALGILAILVLLAVSFLAQRRSWNRPPPARLAVFFALRCVALLTFLVLVLQPSDQRRQTWSPRGVTVVLVDTSASMAVRDSSRAGVAEPRYSAVRRFLTEQRASLSDLPRLSDLRWRRFGLGARRFPRPAPTPRDVKPTAESADQATDLGRALEDALGGLAPREVDAVIVISDGRDTEGSGAARAWRRWTGNREGPPVIAVGVGAEELPPGFVDARVGDIIAPRTVAAGETFQVRARFMALGLKGARLRMLASTQGGAEDARATRRVRSERQEFEETFTMRIAQPGVYRVRARVDVPSRTRELLPENNTAATLVRVREGDVRVVFLSGRREPKERFLLRALGRTEGMRVKVMDFTVRNRRPRLPADADGWKRWDVLVLGDIPAHSLLEREQRHIAAAFSSRRAGILLLSSRREPPSAPVLRALSPFMAKTPRPRSPRDPASRSEETPGPAARALLTAAGRSILEKPDTPLPWETLPALNSGVPAQRVLSGSRVLLASAEGRAFLVVREPGLLRLASMSGGGFWRWALAGDAPAKTYETMVTRLFSWLAGREDRGGASLDVQPREYRVPVGRVMELYVTARGADGAVDSSAAPEIAVGGPRGAKGAPRALFDAVLGKHRAQYTPEIPGEYTITASLPGRKPVATRFLAYIENRELNDPTADHGPLKELARDTGGVFLSGASMGDAFDAWRGVRRTREETIVTRDALWNRWWWAPVFALALGAEWILRRLLGYR